MRELIIETLGEGASMEEKEYYTIPEACKIVGLCDATVRAM